jgi:hypothetical protein
MAVFVVVGTMSVESAPGDATPRQDVVGLWGVALLCFGAGDVVTTAVGLRLTGVVEIQPLAAYLFQYSTFGSMLVLKAAVFGTCYAAWRRTPEPYSIGVPLGLATVGTLTVIWNVRVLLLTVLA